MPTLSATLASLAGHPVDVGLLMAGGVRYDGRITATDGDTLWLVGTFGRLAVRTDAIQGLVVADSAEAARLLGGPVVTPLDPGEVLARAVALSKELEVGITMGRPPHDRGVLTQVTHTLEGLRQAVTAMRRVHGGGVTNGIRQIRLVLGAQFAVLRQGPQITLVIDPSGRSNPTPERLLHQLEDVL